MNRKYKIGFRHKPEKLGGKLLTLPGLYVKPYESLQQYTDKSVEEKMEQAYKDEGMPIPNFEMMDKIERLEALSMYRGQYLDKKAELDKKNQEAEKEYKEQEIQSRIKAEVSNEIARQQQSATAK